MNRMGCITAVAVLSALGFANAGCTASTSEEGDDPVATNASSALSMSPDAKTYSIGGKVSGLTKAASAGLILSNALANGGLDVVAIKADGSFAFPEKLPSGAAYSVAVKTQPSGQQCTVSGGAGVAKGNVTSIVVTCAAASYTVGGSVAGLTGAGLVVTDGKTTLSVPAGARSFAFPTKHASGAAYDVTVVAQPTSPYQSCVVAHASGTVEGANVTNVAIDCAADVFPIDIFFSGSPLYNPGITITDSVSGAKMTAPSAPSIPVQLEMAVSGGSYSITLADTSWQTCTLTGPASGKIAGAGVQLTVSCQAVFPINLTATNGCYEPINFYDGYYSIVAPNDGASRTERFADGRYAGQGYQIGFSTSNSDPDCICTGERTYWGSGTIAGVDYMTSAGGNVTVTCQEAIQ